MSLTIDQINEIFAGIASATDDELHEAMDIARKEMAEPREQGDEEWRHTVFCGWLAIQYEMQARATPPRDKES